MIATTDVGALAMRIAERGERFVEGAAWVWAAGMRRAADAVGSQEAQEVADVIEWALLSEGAWGLVELAMAGPALGGLGANDTARLVAMVDERSAGRGRCGGVGRTHRRGASRRPRAS